MVLAAVMMENGGVLDEYFVWRSLRRGRKQRGGDIGRKEQSQVTLARPDNLGGLPIIFYL